MAPVFNSQAVTRTRLAAHASALVVGALALFVLIFGWVLGWETAKSLVPNGPTMKAHTALAFLSGASCIWLTVRDSQSAVNLIPRRILALLILTIGASTLLELLTGAPVAFDRILIRDSATLVLVGRMSPAAAVAFTCTAIALLAQTFRTRLATAVFQIAILFALAIAFLGLVGFAFSVGALYRVGFYFTFSLHSNICMTLICVGALCSRPTDGLMQWLVADGPSGVLVRNLIPAALVLPLIFGWLTLAVQTYARLDYSIAFAFFCILCTGAAVALILQVSEKLRVADQLQRKALDDVRAGEANLEEAQRIAHLGSFSVDLATQRFTASAEMLRIYGLTPERFDGTREMLQQCIHPDDREYAQTIRPQALVTGGKGNGEFRIVHPDGVQRIVHVEVQYHYDAQGKPVSVAGIVHDITNRREIESALQTSEQRYRSLFDYAPISLWELDFSTTIAHVRALEKSEPGGAAAYFDKNPQAALDALLQTRIVAVNDYTLELYHAKDKSELLANRAKTFGDESSEMLARMLLALANGARRYTCELPRMDLDGKKLLLQSGWAVVPGYEQSFERVIFFSTDITERKRLEQQLLQSQKTESIGRLAGGVAHDFNNLLTSIIGFSELAKMNTSEPERLVRYLDRVLEAAQRGATLTQQLLAYARKKIVKMEVVNLNRLVEQMEPILHRLIGEDVELVVKPGPGLGSVKVDPGSIDQVIMNLAVNARDAMPHGGKLTIETLNVALTEEYTSTRADLTPGDYVMLVVSDCGTGMSAEIVAHIFEPFFTTKPVGKGTGLGLAMCQGIVKQAGGHIAVYSELGKGTSIKIYLPRVASAAPVSSVQHAAVDAHGGKETILVVEDDLLIRECALAVLSELGYDVLLAEDGVEALKIAASAGRPIQLLVTDVVMPKMGGRELATQIQSKYPNVKILFASGYTENAIVHHGVLKEGVNFIQKPYSPSALSRAIRTVLDEVKTPQS